MKLNQNGFSIIQVFIVLAAITGIAYYVLDQQKLQGRQHDKNEHLIAIESAAQLIRTALANVDTCTHNFAGKAVGYRPPNILLPDNSMVASRGQTYPYLRGIKIKNIEIISWKNKTTTETADYLNVVYELDPRNVKNLIGGHTVSKKFRLRGRKSGSNYISCYHEESNLIETAAKESCLTLNGVWNNWDCKLDINQLVDPTLVKCNSGKMALAVQNGKLKVSCL